MFSPEKEEHLKYGYPKYLATLKNIFKLQLLKINNKSYHYHNFLIKIYFQPELN